jgi:hypothetical protein
MLLNIVVQENCGIQKSYNDDYRKSKMDKYKMKRSVILQRINGNLHITIPMITILKWYDIFYDYATMEWLDESAYWMVMKKLKNPFATLHTPIHSILFREYSTSTPHKVNVTEFLLSLLIFNDSSSFFVSLKETMVNLVLDKIDALPSFILHDVKFYMNDEKGTYTITSANLNMLYNHRMKYQKEFRLLFGALIQLNKLMS